MTLGLNFWLEHDVLHVHIYDPLDQELSFPVVELRNHVFKGSIRECPAEYTYNLLVFLPSRLH